jgi:hypothetical protein
VPLAQAARWPLAVLQLRAWARARLWQADELDLHKAVDTLQAAAVRDGLVAKLGQDRVQEIMSKKARRRRCERRPLKTFQSNCQNGNYPRRVVKPRRGRVGADNNTIFRGWSP